MAFFSNRRGLLVPVLETDFYEERRNLVKRLRRAGAVKWKVFPKNSLRHSFATYHLGKSGNPGATAFQMGTSTTLVINTYSVPARRANWKAFWRI
jgi:integrase